MVTDRYHRQRLLGQVGEVGQGRLLGAHVLVVGLGALGSTSADLLARAGVGRLTLVDRDIVELTNLQRQGLFDEGDVREGRPKAVAGARRLGEVNSGIVVKGVVADVHAGNVLEFCGVERGGKGVDLILDGTDNVASRYLMNDVSVKFGIPWVYGAAVGVEGRVMAVWPGRTACLRCVFPTPPAASELPTCDTAGVLGMTTTMVAAQQAVEAVRILTGGEVRAGMSLFDVWGPRMGWMDLAEGRDAGCPCCGMKRFEFLEGVADSAVTLCGRDSVQVRPGVAGELDLGVYAERLGGVGSVVRTPYYLKCRLSEPAGVMITLFSDGRGLISGVSDLMRAKGYMLDLWVLEVTPTSL